MAKEIQVFTLRQVVSSIRKTIEERYQQTYWIKAEMHKLNRFPSGHCFPELLQKEDGKIVAEMRGTIWAHQFERINQRFMEVVKEPLKDDTTLVMQVKVTFHETYGLGLQILDIDPNYALGELQRERQETLTRLQKEGLLNANQELNFPLLPKRVAVISADASKGLSDFYQVLARNEWGYQLFTMLFPASLQGDHAATSIVAQLQRIKHVVDHFDIVVIVRGGGGEVGLSCYNNYDLCAAIASFPIPVLTGIGHSTNLTVAEMVSFRNAITPTELGDFLIQAFHNFSVPVKDAAKAIRRNAKNQLALERSNLNRLSQQFHHETHRSLAASNYQLLALGKQLKTGSRITFNQQREQLERLKARTAGGLKYRFQQHHAELDRWVRGLPIYSNNQLNSAKNRLNSIEQSIRLMDPQNVLKRGYSITTMNGKVLSKDTQLAQGDRIQTRTAHLEIDATVESVSTRKDQEAN